MNRSKSMLMSVAIPCALFGMSGAAYAMEQPNEFRAWYEYQENYLRENAKRPGWIVTPTGLQAKRVSPPGSGAHPTASDVVRVHYTGRGIDGVVFDSSVERGAPAQFPLGRVIQGWAEGVQLMRVNETWDFVIPANLAYGEKGSGRKIPPGSTLLFRIELLAIK